MAVRTLILKFNIVYSSLTDVSVAAVYGADSWKLVMTFLYVKEVEMVFFVSVHGWQHLNPFGWNLTSLSPYHSSIEYKTSRNVVRSLTDSAKTI